MLSKLKRPPIMKIHGYLSMFFLLPMLMYAITGIAYIFGYNGAVERSQYPISVEAWPLSEQQAKAAVPEILAAVGMNATPAPHSLSRSGLHTWRGLVETIVSVPGQPSPPPPDLDYQNDDTLYESEYKYYGIYAQDLISIGEHWQVLIGARNDWVDKDDELKDSNHFLPRLGLTYHPTENSSVYYSYSQSFEPGNAGLIDETDINNGMALDPVQGKQSEIGAKVELFEDRLLITSALFDIDREGTLITEIIDHPEFETRTTLAGVQNHEGFEASASGSVTDRLFVLASTMYIDAQYEKDQRYQGFRPTDVPEWTSSLWTRYEFDNNVALNAGVSYVGDRFADSENQVVKDGYTRVDIGVV